MWVDSMGDIMSVPSPVAATQVAHYCPRSCCVETVGSVRRDRGASVRTITMTPCGADACSAFSRASVSAGSAELLQFVLDDIYHISEIFIMLDILR